VSQDAAYYQSLRADKEKADAVERERREAEQAARQQAEAEAAEAARQQEEADTCVLDGCSRMCGWTLGGVLGESHCCNGLAPPGVAAPCVLDAAEPALLCLPATLVRCCCRLERQVRSKAASLPPEPPADDSEAINLLVRLPAGGRYSRRFRRTDQLQVGVHVSVHAMPAEGVPSGRGAPPSGAPVLCNHQSSPQMAAVTPSHNLHAPRTPLPAYPCLQAVFDFVDVQSGVGGDIPPGSYSLATAYPRRVLQDGAVMSLQDAGLTARQEALFLELK
jgi:hypothetical protein